MLHNKEKRLQEMFFLFLTMTLKIHNLFNLTTNFLKLQEENEELMNFKYRMNF